MTRRAFIWVTHLLGSGHLRRAAALARAVAARGFEVRLVSGGREVDHLALAGVEFVQLPPVASADGGFRSLVDASGAPLDAEFCESRARQLVDCLRQHAPRIVIFETYPFGRRQLEFELKPLLAAVRAMRPRPVLISSIRDILQARSPQSAGRMVAAARADFARVIVHADPTLVRLEDSLPEASAIADLVSYTGFIAETAPPPAISGPGAEIVVSTGGGAVGERLLRTALEARALSTLADVPWRLLAGRDLPEKEWTALRARAREGVSVERARADFRNLLARCLLSVSQAGYNTVMDVLLAGAPAVLVPYAGDGQTEQTLRATRLAALGRAEIVREAELSAPALARAIDRASRGARWPNAGFNMDGAAQGARMIEDLAKPLGSES